MGEEREEEENLYKKVKGRQMIDVMYHVTITHIFYTIVFLFRTYVYTALTRFAKHANVRTSALRASLCTAER